ncbi:hypothetical protein IAU60_001418 [Kwoniella sp. DSM 27419]
MSRDPYVDVKREVEQTLSTLPDLLQSYASTPASSAKYTQLHEEVKSTLELLEGDAEDLAESVRVVEGMGDKWGISPGEVKRRREFVSRVRGEVENLRAKVSAGQGSRSKGKAKASDRNGSRYRDEPDDLERGVDEEEDREEAKRWEAEQQQLLVRRQDDTLGVISGTLHTLASQAGLIGSEVHQQSEMLDDLGNRVDETDSRLRKVTRTMEDFIRRNEETKSGWCIGILIVILIILLLLVIIT